NDVLAPVNQRLQAEGKPPVTAQQLQESAKDSVQGALRTGTLDRNAFESSLAKNTSLSRADVQDVSQRLSAQIDAAKGKMNEAAQTAKFEALKAADKTGKAFWGVFGALALGLLAALAGGALGVPRVRKGEVPAGGPRTAVAPPPRGPIV